MKSDMDEREESTDPELDAMVESSLIASSLDEASKRLPVAARNPLLRQVPIGLAIILIFSLSAATLFGVSSLPQLGELIWLIITAAINLFLSAVGWYVLLYPLAGAIFLYLMTIWMQEFTQSRKIGARDDGIWVESWAGHNMQFTWSDLTSIFLFCPFGSMIPDKWLVGIGSATTERPVTIRMDAFGYWGPGFLKLVKEQAPWLSVDPALIELWEPAIADSRTELWLKSISKAPDEEKLLPLVPGCKLSDGRYLMLSRLGVGGHGTAYLFLDQVTGENVVIKEHLFPVYASQTIRHQAEQRLQSEVELLKKLAHPQVVKLLDSFNEDHRGYLVLEHIEGPTLRQLVREREALPEQEVLKLASQMCEILSYLHGLVPPVVHRDLTPENFMLDSAGKLKLIDFNVAKELEATRTATVVGKHAYIPPEQFRGQAVCASDIYAMGATLHFLLTGQDPEPISQSHPRQVNANVSAEVDALVARATAIDCLDRFQDVSEIAGCTARLHVPDEA